MTSKVGRPRLRAPALVVAVSVAAAGCATAPTGAGQASTATADCAVAVRVDGAVYVESGFSSGRPGHLLGTADLASCDDNGRNPRGSWFDDDPPRVRVWSVRGHDPGEVVAIRAPGGRMRILEADDHAP